MKLIHKFGWFLVSMGIVMVYKINYAFGWRISSAGSCVKTSTACSKVIGYDNVVWTTDGVQGMIDSAESRAQAGGKSGYVCSSGWYLAGCKTSDGITHNYAGDYYDYFVAKCLADGGAEICKSCPYPGVLGADRRYYFNDSVTQGFYWCSAYAMIGGDDNYGLDSTKIDSEGNTYLCNMKVQVFAKGLMNEVGDIHSCVITSGVYRDSHGWFEYTDDCYHGNQDRV